MSSGSDWDGSGFDGQRIRGTHRSVSDSDSGSSDSADSDSSDDAGGVSVRLVGDEHARRKFRRLRRIFLSKPQTSRSTRSKTTRIRSSVDEVDNSDEERVPPSLRRGDRAAGDNQRADEQRRQQSQQALELSDPTGLLQEEIDRQMRALCEQVELLAARRDSSA